MLLLTNANIRVDGGTQAEALAIKDGRIEAAGSTSEIRALAQRGDQILDMQGKTVWPGLIDAHIHLEHYALGLSFIDCQVPQREQIFERVRDRAANHNPGEWVRGHGWNQNLWPEGFGTAAQLDNAAPGNPVYLTAKSLHAAWANSAALNLAGIGDNTPNPPDGQIQRDMLGHATGILLESAMDLVEQVIPAPTVEQVTRAIEAAQPHLWQVGLTGVNDFDGVRCFKALQRLQAEGKLLLRVTKSIPFEFLPQAATIGLRSGFGDVTLRLGNVKCFSDGALGPQTAAMLNPYEGKNAGSGVLMMTSDEILDAGKQAASSGLALAIHAIGDLANRTVLNGFEMLRAYEHSNHLPHLRHRIEHVQLLHPYDYRRLADLDLIASVQPIHATSDMRMADRYWSGRSAGAYAYHTLLKHQTHLAFGADAPVELPNPFLGLHAAVTRRRTDGYPPEGWYPEQRLSLAEALEGFTTGAAYAGYQEHTLGCLAPGYQADLIVLDEDPFTIPPQMIWKVIPSSVMIAGQWVWQKEA